MVGANGVVAVVEGLSAGGEVAEDDGVGTVRVAFAVGVVGVGVGVALTFGALVGVGSGVVTTTAVPEL